MEVYITNLAAARARLLHEISSLNDEDFNREFENNQWSIAQICHHLLKTEVLFRKAIRFGLAQKTVIKADRKHIQVVSDMSVKYQAPKIAEPDSGPFQASLIIQQLSDSRNNLLDVLLPIDDPSRLKDIVVNNPRFGDLPLDQWIELLYIHEQRHTKQIINLKALAETLRTNE